MPNVESEQADSAHFCAVSRVLSELRKLVRSRGFVHALAHAAAGNTFLAPNAFRSPYERLSIKELTLTAGFLSMQARIAGSIPDEETLIAQVEQLYSLLQKLQDVVAQPMTDATLARVKARLSADSAESDVADVRRRAIEMVEPFFYGGVGAYDFQYLDLAVEKYRHDSEWLATNVGLSIDLMVTAASELRRLREMRFGAYLRATTYEESCEGGISRLLVYAERPAPIIRRPVRCVHRYFRGDAWRSRAPSQQGRGCERA